MRPAADPERVAAARDGDRHALETLLSDHLPLVYAVVRRALGATPDVDDVVQETMLRAVRHLNRLRDPDGFRAWLVAIAVRQIQERSRRLARDTPPIDIGEDTIALPDLGADFAAAVEERVDLEREMRAIVRATGFLTGSDREVLALWSQEVVGALTRTEVAAGLALTPAHTAVRVSRMRAQLELALTVLHAWQASPRCPGLEEAGRSWDHSAQPRWLKRLGRHVRGCPQCALAGRWSGSVEWALGAPWLLPVPVSLTDHIHSLATAAIQGGGLGVPVVTAVADGARRLIGYLNVKTAGLAGAGVAGAAAVVVLAVHTVPDVGDPPGALPSRSVAVAPPATMPATRLPLPSAAPSPTAGPGARTVAPEGVASADIYVAPNGNDNFAGTAEQPFATLAKAASVARPGQVIALRSGTYRPAAPVEIATSGTERQRITVSNLVNERPVIDAAAIPAGSPFVNHTGAFWTVQGLEIRNAPGHAYVCRSCRHNVFRRLWLHDNGNTGLMLRDAGTIGNQVLDSDFTRNHDTVDRGGGADGLSIKNGSGAGNVVRGCRFAENSGDGVDLSNFTDPVNVIGNWAYGNGHNRWAIQDFNGPGNGIKLGGGSPAPAVDHVVADNAAWDNAGYGFTEGSNTGRLSVTDNTAYRNGGTGFAFFYSSSRLWRNLALANTRDVQLGGAVEDTGNSWGQPGWTTTVLRSGDPTTARAERTPAGLLPQTTFLMNRKDSSMGASMTPVAAD